MPTRPTSLPRPLYGAPFSIALARAAGVSAGRLRRGDLRAPTRGVRTTTPPPTSADLHARCAEIVPVLPPGAVFSHTTALTLLGIDLPRGTDRDVDLHVTVPSGASWPRRRGVSGHVQALDLRRDVIRYAGLPVLAPAAVWVQLASVLDVLELVVLGDALTRRERPCSAPDALESRVSALPAGTRGVRRLREAVTLVRARTDSCMESRLRYLLVDGGLPCPVVNHPVHDAQGRFVAMPDLTYPGLRIAIEYDGDLHRTDRRVWRRDVARRQALEALGWRVITCTADDVDRTPDRTLAWVRAAIRARR